MTLTTDEVQKLKKLIRDRESGYLNEKTLESAIKAIANHESSHTLDWVILLAIATLLITGMWTLKPKTQVLPTKFPDISTSKVQGLKPNLVYQDNLIDDSPKGSYDFTLMSKGKVKGVLVPSPCNGAIATSENLQGYGNTISVDCEKYRYFFAHLAELGQAVGSQVQEGEAIAIQGSTGNSTGEHIHLEISLKGTGKRIEDRAVTAPLVVEYIERIN